MILRVKVKKQLDGKANGIIESCQEIISELCSIQEWGDFTGGCLTLMNYWGLLTGNDGACIVEKVL